jgi:hypothetical protein
MATKKLTQRVALGTSGSVLVVSHIVFGEDGLGKGQIAGIVPIDTEMNSVEILKANALKLFKLSGTKNLQGFVQAEVVRELKKEEVRAINTAPRSIEVKIEVEEDILAEDIEHGSLNTASNRGDNLAAELMKSLEEKGVTAE